MLLMKDQERTNEVLRKSRLEQLVQQVKLAQETDTKSFEARLRANILLLQSETESFQIAPQRINKMSFFQLVLEFKRQVQLLEEGLE